MKLPLCYALIFLFSVCSAQEKSDSAKSKLKATATFSLNSNGISSVPAFSLGDPAVIASITLTKRWFSYEPTLAYGLDGRPWFIDNWFRIKLVNKPTFEFRTGMNISSFFSEYKLPDEDILQGQRYFAFEVAGIYKFPKNTSLSLLYWNDRGQDPGTLKGHFIDLVADKSDMPIGKCLLLGINVQLFYVDYTDENDGLFIAPKVSSSIRKIPISVFFQAIQPLTSNMSPYPDFSWNLGMSYTL